MALQEILEKINKDVELKKKEIQKETEEQKNKIIEEAIKSAELSAKKILDEGRNKIEIETRQIIANAKISAKVKKEKEIGEWIEKVFEEAKKEILNLPDDEKKKILEDLCNIENKENFDIFVDRKYKNLLKNAKEEDIGDFGVILKSKDGNIKINNTLTEIIKNLRQSISSKVAEILFKQN